MKKVHFYMVFLVAAIVFNHIIISLYFQEINLDIDKFFNFLLILYFSLQSTP